MTVIAAVLVHDVTSCVGRSDPEVFVNAYPMDEDLQVEMFC